MAEWGRVRELAAVDRAGVGCRTRSGAVAAVRAAAAAVVVAVLVVLAGCGGDDVSAVESSPSADSTTAAGPSTTATAAVSGGPPASGEPGELPGEPFEGFVAAGDVLAVVGVAFDDTLNVRELPGADQPVVAELAPTADDVVARGASRLLPSSSWTEVDVADDAGWVNLSFLAYLGQVDDLTAEVISRNGGDFPSGSDMTELGQEVAELLASDDPEASSRIVVTVAPTVGDLGEVTYDVVGVADDSQLGWRLHVFGAPLDGDGEGFSLDSVEATVLCSRGVTDDGRCV